MKIILGLDTSCYTTSVALLQEDGTLLADCRRQLTVAAGGQGIAQSEMVFQHVRHLPEVFAAAMSQAGEGAVLAAVGASARPRPIAESYMPAFLVGQGYAQVLAASHNVPFFSISHQENHILAGVWSAGGPREGRFLAVHASGGTTEVTEVESTKQGLLIRRLGGSGDIAAGQLNDRVGVALGLPFPAGPHLERLATGSSGLGQSLPVAVKNMDISFSGPESHAKRLIAKGECPAAVAGAVELCVAESLSRMTLAAMVETGIAQVLFVGGVCANEFVRRHLRQNLEQGRGARLYFPSREFSPDNAVGSAYFALTCWHNNGIFRI